MSNNSVERVITIFKKNDDESFLGDISIDKIELSELQKIFNLESSNPMYDCYEVSTEHALFFKEKVGIDFDFKKYTYFVECNLID